MKYIMTVSLLLMLLVLNACDANKAEMKTQDFTQTQNITLEEKESDTGSYQHLQPPAPSAPKQEVPPKADWDKKIVKNANLNAEVKDYKTFSKNLREKVKRYGGYVSQEQENATDYKVENTLTIKVPVDQFDAVVADLLLETKNINEKQITSEDVTSEYVDGKSRLEAKKQVRLRYLELLQKAKNMSEIIEVQKEINDIQEEIEMVSGHITFLSHSSAMSTINLTYYQVLNPAARDTGNAGFLTRLKSALGNGLYWIGEVFIGIISLWPFILVLIAGFFFFRKRIVFKTK